MATFRKKIDNRIRVQIENGVALQHRTLFVVVGDRGKDQVHVVYFTPVRPKHVHAGILVALAPPSHLSTTP